MLVVAPIGIAANLVQRQSIDRVADSEENMADVQIEEIVDHLSSEMRSALQETVERCVPGTNFDSHELFREFRRAVARKCNQWERVPDNYVRP